MASDHDGLWQAAREFVDDLTEAVCGLSEHAPDQLRHDVAVDAANLVAAFIDVDDRQTDSELWAYTGAFGPELDTSLVGATPTQVRSSGVVAGRRRWLNEPSVLFDLLAQADRRDGSALATRYYSRALRLAHSVASVDLVPSPDELAAIDRFRSMLLRAFDESGIPRPGQPRPPSPAPVVAQGGSPAKPAAAATAAVAVGPEAAPLPPARPLEQVLAELDELIGLAEVKAEVRLLTNLLQINRLRAERNLPTTDMSLHLVFTGNPGTGKTTVARLIAQIYRSLEAVEKGHLVETDRAGLVAGYVGQTAIKTKAVVEKALGGVLLIDEAYALARGDDSDFGQEAIDTLVKMIEDHRDDLVVIVAGYPAEMHEFVESNPGLRSRFPRTIKFPDYTDDELVAIFSSMGDKSHYVPSDDGIAALRTLLAAQPRDKGFGNARYVRNMFERAVANQAARLVDVDEPSDEHLTTLIARDIVG